MRCAECIHAKKHLGYLVCRAPKVLDWQEKALGCRVGVHARMAWEDPALCGGKLAETRR